MTFFFGFLQVPSFHPLFYCFDIYSKIGFHCTWRMAHLFIVTSDMILLLAYDWWMERLLLTFSV